MVSVRKSALYFRRLFYFIPRKIRFSVFIITSLDTAACFLPFDMTLKKQLIQFLALLYGDRKWDRPQCYWGQLSRLSQQRLVCVCVCEPTLLAVTLIRACERRDVMTYTNITLWIMFPVSGHSSQLPEFNVSFCHGHKLSQHCSSVVLSTD